MMDVRTMASKGQRAMRKQKRSVAQKIFWPLQGGRPRESKPTLLEGVQMGRAIADKLYSEMRAAGLPDKDGVCALVWVKNDVVGPIPFERKDAEGADLKLISLMYEQKLEAVGIALMLADRENSAILLHARPFEKSERSWEITQLILEKWESDWREANSKFKFKQLN